MALRNTTSAFDPLIRCIHKLRQIVIGHNSFWEITHSALYKNTTQETDTATFMPEFALPHYVENDQLC